jgi:hypothetical protein
MPLVAILAAQPYGLPAFADHGSFYLVVVKAGDGFVYYYDSNFVVREDSSVFIWNAIGATAQYPKGTWTRVPEVRV